MNLELKQLVENAWSHARREFGREIFFYHPGMFRIDGVWGKYPAISVTGNQCALSCDHCNQRILESMIRISSPRQLIDTCLNLAEKGNIGVLLSGGSDKTGALPWKQYIQAIREIKEKTKLLISVHSGIIDVETATELKNAGIDQALIDIIGSDETLKRVYHMSDGIEIIENSLKALLMARIPTVPHVVLGLDYGRIVGEYNALDLIRKHEPAMLVIVVLMSLSGTPMAHVSPPSVQDITRFIATARLSLPQIPICLGCARPRNNSDIEISAIDCGVNRIALPSEKTIQHAEHRGLDISYHKTCCSVTFQFKGDRL